MNNQLENLTKKKKSDEETIYKPFKKLISHK